VSTTVSAPRFSAPRFSATGVAALALLSVTAAWGSTFFLIKDVVTRIPPADFLAVRFAVAALALYAVAPSAVRRLSARQWRHGLILGAVYGLAQILQTVGLAHMPASVSGFVTGMYVVFTPLLGAVVLRRPVGRVTWLAVAVATAGLAALSLRGFAVGSGFGVALTLLGAALYAVHILGLGVWSVGREALGLSIVQMGAIAAVCTLFALPGGITVPTTTGDWAGLLYMAFVAGALALVVQTWAQAHLPATRAAVIMTMEPVLAAGFAVAFGGESPTVRMVLGGALVLAAMYLVELGPRRAADAEVAHVGPV
jgi:drug/metabolite transporter (DMT)-like permease